MGEITEGNRLIPEPASKISGGAHPWNDCKGDSGQMNDDQSRAATQASPGNVPGCRLEQPLKGW